MALSVLDENNIIYKDSLNADKKIPNFCSDYGHIGCSIIKRSIWKEDHYEQMRKYSLRRGSVYPTSAAAIISYSADRSIECIEFFSDHISVCLDGEKASKFRNSW